MNADMCCEVIMTIWEGTWDIVSFSETLKRATRLAERCGGDEKAITMEIIQVMLKDGHMVAGDVPPDTDNPLDPGAVEPWESSVEQTLARIERKWEHLEGFPAPSEVCWFATTDKGKKLLEKYNLNEEPFE